MIRRRRLVQALGLGILLAVIVVGLYVVPGPCHNDLAAPNPELSFEYVGRGDSLTLVNTGDPTPGPMTTAVTVVVIDNQTEHRETITWYDRRKVTNGDEIRHITITDNDTSLALDSDNRFHLVWTGYEVPAYCLGRDRVSTVLLADEFDGRSTNRTVSSTVATTPFRRHPVSLAFTNPP